MTVSFEHAVLRVVPRVERGERLNVGVVLYARAAGFLDARVVVDRARLAALWPLAPVELDELEHALALIPRLCAGDAATGPIAALPQAERFRWIVAPRSTIVQAGPVHVGICDEPARALDRLVATMVTLRARD